MWSRCRWVTSTAVTLPLGAASPSPGFHPVNSAQATRGRILGRAAEFASEEGLDGITIGRLAEELEMSKSGVHKHFGTKEMLQISTLDKVFVDFWHRGSNSQHWPNRRACGGCGRCAPTPWATWKRHCCPGAA